MAKKHPKATHSGVLTIGDHNISCYVLENKERILSTRGIMKSLGRRWRGRKYSGTQLPVFLEAKNLNPFIDKDLDVVLSPKKFKTDKGVLGDGYNAEILPAVCDTYLKAREAGVLTQTQEKVAKNCEILVRALSKVGIIALVDEVTGYQYDRDRDELNRILEAYIAKELLPWTKQFPNEFYRQLFKLRGWQYSPLSVRRPQIVGKLTNELVYDKLPPGILNELRRKNPRTEKGYRKHKFHQFLTEDIGHPHLGKQLASVITLMRVSPNWRRFYEMFKRAFPKSGDQLFLDLNEPDEKSKKK